MPRSCCLAALLASAVIDGALVRPASRPTVRRLRTDAPRLQAGGDEEGNAFAAFAARVRGETPLKPGEGSAVRPDVKGLPIRLGGTARDGSLGDLRAASKTVADVKNWGTEEVGLLGVFAFLVISYAWGYNEYVVDKPPADDEIYTGNYALDRCMNDAFGGSEKMTCKAQFGGPLQKATLGLFP